MLAFSGGLLSTAAIPWLSERAGVDVVTVTLDLGQGRELEGIRERALAAGAIRAHVLDRVGAFVADAVWPLVQAGVEPLPPAQMLPAPLIARALVDVARLEGASGLAHGARGSAARQLDTLWQSLGTEARLLETAGLHEAGPGALVRYLEERAIPLPRRSEAILTSTTIWGRTVRGHALGDDWLPVPDDVSAASIEITFERGVPVAVNGIDMPLVELVESVATIAGAHGVGLSEVWVDDGEGKQRREVREWPAGTVLLEAHRALESRTLDARHHAFRPQLAAQYLALQADGGWFSPFRRSLDAYRLDAQAQVNGTVRLSLHKGHCRVAGLKTPQYDRAHTSLAL